MNATLKFVWRVLVLLVIAAFVIFVWPGPWLKNLTTPAPAPAQPVVQPTVAAEVQQPEIAPVDQPQPAAPSGAGTVASDQATNMAGYQASPIGGLTSSLPMLCETWGPVPEGGNRGFVVTIPAGSIMWEQNHYGGTCWWVDPADLDNAVQKSVTNITNRDGIAPIVVRLPDDTFPLLGCLQTTPVNAGVRRCDAVGTFAAYDAPAQLPDPGLFPGYGK